VDQVAADIERQVATDRAWRGIQRVVVAPTLLRTNLDRAGPSTHATTTVALVM